MPEIELHRRYPNSRPEDITDAYMRGFNAGMEIANSQHERVEAPARRIDALECRIERIERAVAEAMGIDVVEWDEPEYL